MSDKYSRNFLSRVVARVDYAAPIFALQEELPAAIGTPCAKLFPIVEPRDLNEVSIIVRVADGRGEQQQTKKRQWHFYGKNREKRLVIDSMFISVEFLDYDNFETFSDQFTTVMATLFQTYSQLEVARLGLRYLNRIELPGQRFSWGHYLNGDLLRSLSVPPDKTKIARSLHNLELNLGDYMLRFQYGMHNPDYPAPIKKKVFTLDYDAYIRSPLTEDEIRQRLPIFHDEILRMFESSIKDRLRERMND